MLSHGSALLLLAACVSAGVYSVTQLYALLGGKPSSVQSSAQGPAEARVAAKAASRALSSRRTLLLLVLVASLLLGAFAGREMNIKDFDPYLELGVAATADTVEVTRAYRKLSLKNHPDRGGDVKLFQRITRAYHTLTKEADRRNYERFGNPEGVFEDKFGSMRGTSKLTQVLMMLAYLASFVALIAASYMYVNRKRSVEEAEATLPAYLRHIRRSLRGVDVVEALPGAPTGTPSAPLPSEEDFKATLLEANPEGPSKHPVAGVAARRHGLAFDRAAWKRDSAFAAAGAPPPAPPAPLPQAATGQLGLQEFLDFYEPRFERVARCLAKPAPPAAMGDAATPQAEVLKFYTAWEGSDLLRLAPVDYYDRFKAELQRAMGSEAAEAELARDEKKRWEMLKVAYELDKDKKAARKEADEARLRALVAAARQHDPRVKAHLN